MPRYQIQAPHCKRVTEYQKPANVILPNPINTTFRRVLKLRLLCLRQLFTETHNLNHFREEQKIRGSLLKLKSNFMILHLPADYPYY